MKPPRRRVREPVQVYLDPDEKALLEEASRRAAISQAEVLRRGLRRMAGELLSTGSPGSSLRHLVGALEDPAGTADLPPDLARNHDAYLYPPDAASDPRRD